MTFRRVHGYCDIGLRRRMAARAHCTESETRVPKCSAICLGRSAVVVTGLSRMPVIRCGEWFAGESSVSSGHVLPSLGFILPLVYDGCFIAIARDWECGTCAVTRVAALAYSGLGVMRMLASDGWHFGQTCRSVM